MDPGPHATKPINKFTTKELQEYDPLPSLFRSEIGQMCIGMLYREFSALVKEVVRKSRYFDTIRDRFSGRFSATHFNHVETSLIVADIVQSMASTHGFEAESKVEKACCLFNAIGVDLRSKLHLILPFTPGDQSFKDHAVRCQCAHEHFFTGRASRSWAVGVLACIFLCGPPRQDRDERCVKFCAAIGLGPALSKTGFPTARGWCDLNPSCQRFILKMLHQASDKWVICEDYQSEPNDPFSHNDPFFQVVEEEQEGDDNLPLAALKHKDDVMARDDQKAGLKSPQQQEAGIIRKTSIHVQQACKAELIEELPRKQKDVPSSEWNSFWNKKAKDESKNRRKPLTKEDSRLRKQQKHEKEVAKKRAVRQHEFFNDFTKPVCDWIHQPIHRGNIFSPSYPFELMSEGTKKSLK